MFTKKNVALGISLCLAILIACVSVAVWSLYQFTLRHVGAKPTLIEWDSNVPSWDVLYQEAQKIEHLLNQYQVVA